MIDDRKHKPKRSGGWTPHGLGLSAATLTMAGGIGNLAGRVFGPPRADRYPKPVQGGAELRRRLRQQERLARKRNAQGA